jgi:peptide/nickel transport system permease protein|uniref:ABC transporter permease n=1 Tax=Paractinoplanes polyasparticus TaxID=2856853 RepID=UPI001C8600F4|nr:ABC transporter permease [Actinoplanes polyasparticus]
MSVAAEIPRLTGLTGNPWVRFGFRRAGRLVLSVWVLVTAAFLMIHVLPGDPVRAALGPTAPLALVAERREQLGLDDPLWQQYLSYLGHLLTGDLGVSMTSGLPVSEVISARLGSTVEMALLAFAVAVVVSVPLGLFMAVLARDSRRRGGDWALTSAGVVVATIPEFLMAVGLVFVFGVQLGWLPVAGRSGPSSYVLPVLSLAIGPAFMLARIVRVELLTVLQTDYIRTARAKRLRAGTVYLRHALPNALTATLTIGGLLLGGLVAGTVLIENIFAWPGLGSTIVGSILAKDYPTVQGVVLVYGIGVLLINLVVDVALAVLDPRSAIRES